MLAQCDSGVRCLSEARPSPSRARSALRKRLLCPVILLACLSFSSPAPPQLPQVDENRVKAAYLYNFARFVDWPAASWPQADGPTLICSVGDDRLAEVLQQAVVGKQANGRRIETRRISSSQEGRSCHILLIGFHDSPRVLQMLRGLQDTRVLTVGQIDGFTDLGGMINLVRTERAVELEINPKAAEAAGLKISSRLLAVSRVVTPSRGEERR
jgi:YfiR/HmsC-like